MTGISNRDEPLRPERNRRMASANRQTNTAPIRLRQNICQGSTNIMRTAADFRYRRVASQTRPSQAPIMPRREGGYARWKALRRSKATGSIPARLTSSISFSRSPAGAWQRSIELVAAAKGISPPRRARRHAAARSTMRCSGRLPRRHRRRRRRRDPADLSARPVDPARDIDRDDPQMALGERFDDRSRDALERARQPGAEDAVDGEGGAVECRWHQRLDRSLGRIPTAPRLSLAARHAPASRARPAPGPRQNRRRRCSPPTRQRADGAASGARPRRRRRDPPFPSVRCRQPHRRSSVDRPRPSASGSAGRGGANPPGKSSSARCEHVLAHGKPCGSPSLDAPPASRYLQRRWRV